MLPSFIHAATRRSLILAILAACGSPKTVTVLGPFGTPPEDTGTATDSLLEPIACPDPSDTVAYTESGTQLGLRREMEVPIQSLLFRADDIEQQRSMLRHPCRVQRRVVATLGVAPPLGSGAERGTGY